jgi:hypothetical protein
MGMLNKHGASHPAALLGACLLRVASLHCFSTLKIEAANFSQTIRRHIPEDNTVYRNVSQTSGNCGPLHGRTAQARATQLYQHFP